MSKIDYSKIPESLRERRGGRAMITIWFGFLPLLLGVYGIYQYYATIEQTFKGSPDAIFYEDYCGDQVINSHCLYVIIGNDTLHTTLSENGVENCLRLFKNYNAELQQEINNIAPHEKSRIKMVTNKFKTKKLKNIGYNVNEIKITYVNSIIKSLTINQIKITSQHSAFWWGLILLIVGIAWVGIHIWFYVKDPYNVYI